MPKLQGKVAVVTGAGSGMGKCIATLFAKEGAKVIAADINQESINAVVSEITADGGETKAVIANVTKEEDVQNMIDEAINTYGTLDILVNNAGILDN
ncbi:MAG: SDR family NAD(P)-dependent oxidoreductase, partial [Dehalococcoidales bacterium]|nr:SDR family NAD(P)-dependent oxidoreductase [Dehalococcoidales bacterium]